MVPNGKKYGQDFSVVPNGKKYGLNFLVVPSSKIRPKNFLVVPSSKIRPKNFLFYFLQIRVYRDLLLFHMIYDFILDTSGTKGPCPNFYVFELICNIFHTITYFYQFDYFIELG